jgi:phosphonate transport system permease protein
MAPAPFTSFDQERPAMSAPALTIPVPVAPLAERVRPWIAAGVIVALLAWSWTPVEAFKAKSLWTDGRNMAQFGAAFLKPDFHDWRTIVSDMMLTVQIAVWGTALAVVFGVPFGILSSANVAPAWIVWPVRRLMDIVRAVNEIVLALMFVVAVGLGPFAGVMALFVHNTGVIAKLFSEAVESIDPRPVEGIRSTGASSLQEVIYGIVPQVIPLWSSYALYRFETNVRSATVLGIIGAGGIGQTLYQSIQSFQYGETAACVLIMIATVMLIDMVSARLRELLV